MRIYVSRNELYTELALEERATSLMAREFPVIASTNLLLRACVVCHVIYSLGPRLEISRLTEPNDSPRFNRNSSKLRQSHDVSVNVRFLFCIENFSSLSRWFTRPGVWAAYCVTATRDSAVTVRTSKDKTQIDDMLVEKKCDAHETASGGIC